MKIVTILIMGWADYLLKMQIPYGTTEANTELERILEFIYIKAKSVSEKLGEEKGVPEMCKLLPQPRRNITLLTVAPTGTVSLFAGCSSGIEPIFSEVTVRNDKTGTYQFDHELAEKPYFRCAVSANGGREVTWEEHIYTLASAQKYVDSGVSKCIEKGTLIPTDKGLIRVEDFSDNSVDDSFANTRESFYTDKGSRILSHYKAGKKPATRLTLDNGATITGATESHKILTEFGWKTLKDIRIGDIVLGRTIQSHGVGGQSFYWSNVFTTNSNKINVPEKVTVPFAKFLGMVTADGHTNVETGYTGITCKDADVEKEFIDLCHSLFATYPNITLDKRNGVKSIYLTSRNLARFVEALIGKGAYNKKVPTEILRGNAEEKLAYLSGLSLDGYVVRGELCIYAGMSESLARDVAEICRSFGYNQVYIGNKKVKGFGTAFSVTVGGFLQEMIVCVEKRKNVTPYEKDYLVYVGRDIIEHTRVPLKHPKYYALKNMRIIRKKQTYCWFKTARALGWDTSILAYKVKAVENVGSKDLFDIEVDSSHEYAISGVISHNTINFPKMAHRDSIAKAFILAWKLGCKGLAVYRNGSRNVEVLSPKDLKKDKCPLCGKELIKFNGTRKCSDANCEFVIVENKE